MPLPLHTPRTRRYERCMSHDERRLTGHQLDPARVRQANEAIGMASWKQPFSGLFGNPAAIYVPPPSARVIGFPSSFHGKVAEIRAELDELKRSMLRR
jgi:hypothetical protein